MKELSQTEAKIYNLLKNGKTTKEIASDMYISVHTVNCHINTISKKLKPNK